MPAALTPLAHDPQVRAALQLSATDGKDPWRRSEPSEASLYLLYSFIGFVVASQLGGRMLDRIGAKRPVVLGCVLPAVGFWLWPGR